MKIVKYIYSFVVTTTAIAIGVVLMVFMSNKVIDIVIPSHSPTVFYDNTKFIEAVYQDVSFTSPVFDPIITVDSFNEIYPLKPLEKMLQNITKMNITADRNYEMIKQLVHQSKSHRR